MSLENTELLERAVINLTVENAKLKKEVSQLKDDKESYWRWYTGKKDQLERKESEVLDLQKEIKSLKMPSSKELAAAEVVLSGDVNEEETE